LKAIMVPVPAKVNNILIQAATSLWSASLHFSLPLNKQGSKPKAYIERPDNNITTNTDIIQERRGLLVLIEMRHVLVKVESLYHNACPE
jgi:hypothetical protein